MQAKMRTIPAGNNINYKDFIKIYFTYMWSDSTTVS